ncbi:Hypothetical_protein [Hexamita inflata]|uniref:Hypothetical_protein n=1 Tax=Hexamita inflata TaxID=28002 RepID=A0AA86QCH9_9EUKA|nr:Hypothetical protein HINF_LOCUS41292 [Hexamita inflata]
MVTIRIIFIFSCCISFNALTQYLSNIIVHPNQQKFKIQEQKPPKTLWKKLYSKKVQTIEHSYLNLKTIQNAHSASTKQTGEQFKEKIKMVIGNLHSEQIHFTSKMVGLLQLMNE